jgi:hypothetical protein
MAEWTSELYPNEPIIGATDATPLTPHGYSKGYEPRDYKRNPVGYSAAGRPARDKSVLTPRSEWDDRIAFKEANKSRISDVLRGANIPSLDQNGTNYCWIFGVVGACQARRAVAGLPYVPLSPACGGAQIKSFRNQGGWGNDAVDWMVEHGVCSQATWPQAAIERKYLTEAARIEASRFRLTEWDDCEENDFDAVMSFVLAEDPIPFAIGLDWWGHLIFGCDGVKLGANKYGIRIRNSWGASYGDNGFAVLEERKCLGDAYGIRVMSATEYAA